MARVLYWFRTDLRLHDSPALDAALQLKPAAFYPIWCWDPQYVFHTRVGKNRFQFLLDCQNNLSENITKLNKKSKLFVLRASPQDILPILFKQWKITHLVFEKDTCQYARRRDTEVKAAAKKAGVEVVDVHGHSLYDPELVIKANKGKAPLTYNHYLDIVAKMPKVPAPIPAPTSLPDPGDTTLDVKRQDVPVNTTPDLNANWRVKYDSCFEHVKGPKGDFAITTLDEMGMDEATTPHKGGEDLALERMAAYLKEKVKVAKFEKPKTSPADFLPPSTTLLSPHLKFGALSPRLLYHEVHRVMKEVGHGTKPPVSLDGQLLWRDFYYAAALGTPNFDRIRGNPVSRFIDWKLLDQYSADGKLLDRRPDEEGEERYRRWEEGTTGFPWIDALMRQLHRDGWIHHLARHSLACFLTRGHCYVSWERGLETFDKFLIDWDPALNAGNWLWLSASAFFHQYFRVYSPHFGQKYDPEGLLIKEYIPELKNFPKKYIYEPWKAPKEVQKKAGCIIGEDYPEPMLDADVERKNCIARMKAAYQLGLYGNDPKVMSGEAQGLIQEEPHEDATKAKKNQKQLKVDASLAKKPTDNKHSFGADPKEVKADTAGGGEKDYYSEGEDLDEYGSDTGEGKKVEEEEMIKHEDLSTGQKKRTRQSTSSRKK